jgi:hypothetical protein
MDRRRCDAHEDSVCRAIVPCPTNRGHSRACGAAQDFTAKVRHLSSKAGEAEAAGLMGS